MFLALSCLCVCLFGFVEATLCAISMIQSYTLDLPEASLVVSPEFSESVNAVGDGEWKVCQWLGISISN